jgi:hypothetical protein
MSERVSPSHGSGYRAAGSPSHSTSTLNPTATLFSPSQTLESYVTEDLSEWLLFSPSSSEGRSGRFSSLSSASFTDVVRRSSGRCQYPEDRVSHIQALSQDEGQGELSRVPTCLAALPPASYLRIAPGPPRVPSLQL